MPVPTVCESLPRRDNSRGGQGPQLSRVFTVVAESENDAYDVLDSNSGVHRGAIYEDPYGIIVDSFAICHELRIRTRIPAPNGGTGLYHVEADYRYPDYRNQRQPVLADGAPQYRIERSIVSVPADKQLDGSPITNAAGEPLNPPRSKLVFEQTLVAEWMYPFDDWFAARFFVAPFEGKLNSTLFKTAPRGSLFCSGIDPVEIAVPGLDLYGQPAFHLTASFIFRPPLTIGSTTYEGWQDVFPNLGRRIRTAGAPAGSVPVKDIIGADGKPITEDWPLSADGLSTLGAGVPPNYRVANYYPYADFNLIGLP